MKKIVIIALILISSCGEQIDPAEIERLANEKKSAHVHDENCNHKHGDKHEHDHEHDHGHEH